jgi:hypothetical protein
MGFCNNESALRGFVATRYGLEYSSKGQSGNAGNNPVRVGLSGYRKYLLIQPRLRQVVGWLVGRV